MVRRRKAPSEPGAIGGGRSIGPPHCLGFSLVEILVSAMFLSLAFLALISVFAAARVSIKKAYYTNRAIAAAANKFEVYRGYGYKNISGTATDTISELPSPNQLTTDVTGYDRVTNSAGLKMVTATLAWPGSRDASYEAGRIQLQTLIADRQNESAYRTKRGY
jgi:type II secretory pathway pseudopilin PulG